MVILVVTELGQARRCVVQEGDAVVGRAASWHVVINDESISRQHARIVVAADSTQGMRAAMRQLNAERHGPPMRVRIAINSGTAIVGDVGSARRREYTVLGDVVNIASRLESSVAKPEQIVISRATFDGLREQIPAEPIGTASLRGHAAQVETFSV